MKNKELIELVTKEEKIVIVGNGDEGEYLFHLLLPYCDEEKLAVCDNSHKKQGNTKDYEVLSVEKAVKLFPEALYLITSNIHENTLRMQLISLGISQNRVLLGVTRETKNFLENKKQLVKLQPLKKLQFEIDIVSHCNLNCRSCSQFSCIAEEEFIDIKGMERDFARLGELFGGEVKRIYLIGGEPLLHPQITECMKIARKYFAKGEISIFTNGLLLPNSSEEFWRICRENDISIIVTKYPIQLDYQRIVDKAETEKVRFSFFGTSENFKYMTNLGLDIEGKQDVVRSFVNCGESNNCIKLRNGKLYTCTRPAAIYKFNRFFNMSLEVTERDSIDIYGATMKEEILHKLAEPIPFCRYCDILGERKAQEWGQTRRTIEEWV